MDNILKQLTVENEFMAISQDPYIEFPGWEGREEEAFEVSAHFQFSQPRTGCGCLHKPPI